jgi:hypothetical protein
MAKKVLYRSVIQYEVLSEEPIPDGMDLEEIIAECYDGEYSGKSEIIVSNKPIVGKRAVKFVEKQGSDVEFFNMDANGNELEEEDYDEDEEDGLSGSMTMDEGWQY